MSSLQSHTAKGTLCGFLFQVERAVCRLIHSDCKPGTKVGIESLDDVSVIDKDGVPVLLEQDKYTSSNGNNVTDGSHELWNTLHIWVKAFAAGELLEDRTQLVLVTTGRVKSGIARTLSDATDLTQVRLAYQELLQYPNRAPQGILELVEQVLSYPSDSLLKVIRCFALQDKEDMGTLGGLHEALESYPLLVDFDRQQIGDVADGLWGWVARLTVGLVRAGRPTWIERDHALRQFRNLYDKHRGHRALEAASQLMVSQVEIAAHTRKTFVRQLESIDCESADILDAIDDFIRCHSDRVRWAKKVLVTHSDLHSFDTNLKKQFRAVRLEFTDDLRRQGSNDQKAVGKKVLGRVLQHRERLAGYATEQAYTTRGRYHFLADRLEVGWHPDYEKIFARPKTDRSDGNADPERN